MTDKLKLPPLLVTEDIREMIDKYRTLFEQSNNGEKQKIMTTAEIAKKLGLEEEWWK